MTTRSILPASPRGYDIRDQDFLRQFIKNELQRTLTAGTATVGDVEIDGNFHVFLDLIVDGDISFSGVLTGGDAVFDNLSVLVDAMIAGDLDVDGDVSIAGELNAPKFECMMRFINSGDR